MPPLRNHPQADDLPADDLRERLTGVTIRDRHRLARQLERATRQAGEPRDRELARLARQVEEAEALRAARALAVPDVRYPEHLPVSARRDEILAAISDHQVVIVAGETGSGKTTQLPKLCLELGRGVDGMIGHTQPRRIAARTVAERIAEELDVPLGGAVGYAVRFDDTVGAETLVKVMTDGILLAEIRRDRWLSAYDTVIVDEAHERSLNIDFLLGYLTQLLPRRPDLKVVVTSATIDTARFAEHFHAPVVEVSGRTYPVEVRYRPLNVDAGRYRPLGVDATGGGAGADRDRDPLQALCDAVHELCAEGPGDVLVFLPGERDIRDAAGALAEAGPEEIELLPLYARLSAAEQHRVFRPHGRRRVVLATNVAETSLTVPGVRYVVDTGLARISRYSHRTKVQRLPIEPVSQASADQRAGRCGRVAPGVCIRLYSEEEYAARPEFTDPEILRTNLASVVLQMAAIGLGEIERFPFVEPPDRRSVADGRALLEELGAFAQRDGRLQLTPTGRRLAQLPLDPRLGRMVLEAERRGCLREVTVIAAALSVPDPRERPAEDGQAADELHRRFAVPDSDFLAYVRLWDYLTELRAELSANQFRRRCRDEYLNVLRIREWQDVASQIRQSYRSEGGHANSAPAHPDQVHQALLAGLLSQVGVRDRVRGDYQGARGSRWQVGRGSALSRRQPPWAMAGALVETGQTWARTVARIEPGWAEQLGAHLVRRSHAAPWWDAERGEAMTNERVTLYGLPVVAGRRTSLGRVDPVAARELFVQHALVGEDWPGDVDMAPLERNRARVAEVRALEERARQHDLLADESALYAFYDSRLPSEVTSGRRFAAWWRRVAHEEPELLDVPLATLLDPAAGPVDLAQYPDRWVHGGLDLPLVYRWEPGAEDDGITVRLPLVSANQLPASALDWLVPGYRYELVDALVRALPKAVRRALVPAADVVREVVATTSPTDGPLLEVVARRLAALGGDDAAATLRDPEKPWDRDRLPPHLRMRVALVDEHGRVRGSGRDLDVLRHELRDEIRAAIARALPGLERHGATAWAFGDLPRQVEQHGARGYPSLVDEGDAVGVVVLDDPAAQAGEMWRGTRRLLLLAVPLPEAHLQRRLTNAAKLTLARSKTPLTAVFADCAAAVADQLIATYGGPPYEESGFTALAEEARRTLVDRVARLASTAGEILAAAELVAQRVLALEARDQAGALGAALADVRRQLAGLVRPGFVAQAGADRLPELPRYLAAITRRLEQLPTDARRDAERRAAVERVQARYDALASRRAGGRGTSSAPELPGAGLAEVRWMIEELRVSLWAQSLGTPAPVSEARILRAIDRLATGAP